MIDATTLMSLAASLVLIATASHAGVWAEFERRCLIPFETKTPTISDGLTAGPSDLFQRLRDGEADALPEQWQTFRPTPETFVMATVAPDADNFAGCMVLGLTEGGAEAEAQAILDRVFYSTDWRQPRLQVNIGTAKDPDGLWLSVSERSHD